jgi:hypothetical protein
MNSQQNPSPKKQQFQSDVLKSSFTILEFLGFGLTLSKKH